MNFLVGNKNQNQKLLNFYAKSYAITKFDCSYYNEIFTINNDSTPILLLYMCGHAICAREVLKGYEILQ